MDFEVALLATATIKLKIMTCSHRTFSSLTRERTSSRPSSEELCQFSSWDYDSLTGSACSLSCSTEEIAVNQ